MDNINQVVDKLTPMFQAVAEKIGEGAGFGWKVVYTQQIAYGIKDAIQCAIELIILIVLIIASVKLTKIGNKKCLESKMEYDSGWLSLIIIPNLVLFVYLIIFSLDFFTRLGSAILHLINPSYYALEFFINLVK